MKRWVVADRRISEKCEEGLSRLGYGVIKVPPFVGLAPAVASHPDMVFFDKGDEVYKREAKRICTAAKEMDIPLELNLLGIYDNRNYPDERFLKVAGEVGCKMILGFDAHDPYRAFDDKSLVKAEELINKYNLNIISDLEDRM